MDLDEARHVLANTARINEGGYVAACRDLVLAELDRQQAAERAVRRLCRDRYLLGPGMAHAVFVDDVLAALPAQLPGSYR